VCLIFTGALATSDSFQELVEHTRADALVTGAARALAQIALLDARPTDHRDFHAL
jgi:hypothetical protein